MKHGIRLWGSQDAGPYHCLAVRFFPERGGRLWNTCSRFLHDIGALVGKLHLSLGIFIPLIMVCLMTKMAESSFRKGKEIWLPALFAGSVFTVPQMLAGGV